MSQKTPDPESFVRPRRASAMAEPHPDEDGDVDLEEDDYAVGAEW